MSLRKIIFVDRDGTLLDEPADFQIDSLKKMKWVKSVIPSLLKLQTAGFRFVMVTNQDGLGTQTYPQDRYEEVQEQLIQTLRSQSISFDDVLVCPHLESDRCTCRKPQTGLVQKYLADPDWDRTSSYVIGDRQTDLDLARNMGIQGFRLGDWVAITSEILEKPRKAIVSRKTKETEVSAELILDGTGRSEIRTGLGFFDHMLEQLSKHGGFDLKLKVEGDLHIDDHHTIEDTALVIGEALRRALGDKVGISRYGFFLPMDEATALVGLDLSGRELSKIEVRFSREKVGELATEMVPHFFRSLAAGLQATLHIQVTGENTHHMVESMFKAVGRSLRQAMAKTNTGELPSTKGVL